MPEPRSHIVKIIDRQFIRMLVQTTIFCPITEAVLDTRTAVAFTDKHGDPVLVVSRRGWRIVKKDTALVAKFAAKGVFVPVRLADQIEESPVTAKEEDHA